jgi:hypothetical protein
MNEGRIHTESKRQAVATFYQERYVSAPDDQWRYFRSRMLLHKAGVRLSDEAFATLKRIADQLPNNPTLPNFLLGL